MKSTDAFPSKYISAADLQGREAIVKITHIAPEEIGGKKKFICFFAGKQKGLVLNKTNWNMIAKITGHDDTDDWTGAQVCLYETYVDYQGESVPAVRVKPLSGIARGGQPGPRPSSAEMRDPEMAGGDPRDQGSAPARPRTKADAMDDEIPFAPEFR